MIIVIHLFEYESVVKVFKQSFYFMFRNSFLCLNNIIIMAARRAFDINDAFSNRSHCVRSMSIVCFKKVVQNFEELILK